VTDDKLQRPARVVLPEYPEAEATIVALRCETCSDLFVPLGQAVDGPRVLTFVVAAVDAICAKHHGHVLTCYAVTDDGEEVSGPLLVCWASKGAVLS
jgi:hypothetical protein